MDPTASQHRREGAFDLSTEELLRHSDSFPARHAENSEVLQSLGAPVLSKDMQKPSPRAVMDPHNSNVMIPVTGTNPGQSSQDGFRHPHTLTAKSQETEGMRCSRRCLLWLTT